MSELLLRPAGPEDDEAMRALNAAAFDANPKTRPEITRWQWWDNPFGSPLAWVWDDEGEIVAQYVAYCLPGRLAGQPITFTLGVDAAIAPSHQGRRLFTPLAEALYADANRRDMPMIAYPNEQSVRGIARAGWQEVAALDVHLLVIDDAWLAGKLHLPRAAAHLARRAVFHTSRAARSSILQVLDDPPDGIDELWARVADPDGSGVARHGDWWRWRYAQHPDRPYRFLAVETEGGLRGAAVVRSRTDLGGRFLCLLELLADDPTAAAAIVAALADGIAGPADGVALTAMPGSHLARMARQAGLRRPPSRLLPRPIHFGVVPHPRLLPDPGALAWSTSWGDLDHI
jgi:hypothetical protein